MCIIIFLAVRWHWGMWRFVKLRPGEHGRIMYICIFHKNASQISHIIFPNNNPSVSHIWHCSNTPLFRKQGHFLFRDALVRVTSSLSSGSALYFIPGHICISHIPQQFQPQQGDYIQNWLFSFALENCTHPRQSSLMKRCAKCMLLAYRLVTFLVL